MPLADPSPWLEAGASTLVELLAALPQPAFVVARHATGGWCILATNPQLDELSGVCFPQHFGEPFGDYLPAASVSTFEARYEEAVSAAQRIEYDETHRLVDTEQLYRTALHPLRAADGSTPRILGITAEVSATRAMESDLARTRRQLAFALHAADAGDVEHDLDQDEILLNTDLATRIGLVGGSDPLQEDGISTPFEELLTRALHPADRARYRNAHHAVAEDREPRRVDFRTHPDLGPVRWFQERCTYLAAERLRPARLFGLWLDVTEERERIVALDEANRKLQVSNEDLREFTRVASHDLKAPMRGVSQLAHWLAEDHSENLDEEGRELVQLLERRARRMHDLVTALQHYYELGVAPHAPSLIPLGPLVHSVIEWVSASPELSITCDARFPDLVADPTAVELVLRNLLANAVKHHDRSDGRIHIAGFRDLEGQVHLQVEDDGPGIPADQQQRVFALLTRLDAEDADRGSGMGLAIVRRAMERAGGGVTIEDSSLAEAPRGARMHCWFPPAAS